jgi:hypothetical protein
VSDTRNYAVGQVPSFPDPVEEELRAIIAAGEDLLGPTLADPEVS